MTNFEIYHRVPLLFETSLLYDLAIHLIRFLKELQGAVLARTRPSILKLSTLLFSFIILCRYTPVQMYHFIRHQSLVRLYVMFNFLDVCEKLVATLLLDLAEAIAKDPKFLYYILNIVFTTVQSFISYLYFAALHVSINSNTDKLYSLLIGVNFYEVRAVVFKKYTAETINELYELDLMKRFTTIIFLVLIYLLNIRENYDSTYDFVFSIAIFYLTKMGVDWLKHAYIWRYNKIKEHVYKTKSEENYIPLCVVVLTVVGYLYRHHIPFMKDYQVKL